MIIKGMLGQSLFSQTTTTATPVAQSPFRFSQPFQTSSTGTLFGGSAALNVTKPLGN